MPVPFSQADLKARFETGDVPTGQDFADLIDTFFNLFQTAEADSAAALANANALLANWAHVVLVADNFVMAAIPPNPADPRLLVNAGVSSFTWLSGTNPRLYRATFSTPFLLAGLPGPAIQVVQRQTLNSGVSYVGTLPADVITATYVDIATPVIAGVNPLKIVFVALGQAA